MGFQNKRYDNLALLDKISDEFVFPDYKFDKIRHTDSFYVVFIKDHGIYEKWVYIGQLKNSVNKKSWQGVGMAIRSDGWSSMGFWINRKLNGYSKSIYKYTSYLGGYKNNKHGYGTIFFRTGKKLEGYYKFSQKKGESCKTFDPHTSGVSLIEYGKGSCHEYIKY